MTPAMLERATFAFRKGYWAASRGDTMNDGSLKNAGYMAKPFAATDYRDGYKAAQIEIDYQSKSRA